MFEQYRPSQQDVNHFYNTWPNKHMLSDACDNSDVLRFVQSLSTNHFRHTVELTQKEIHDLSLSIETRDLRGPNIEEESEDDDDPEQSTVDIQDIVWPTMDARDELLKARNRAHKSFTSIPFSMLLSHQDINAQLVNDSNTWRFKSYFKDCRPRPSHFQLRSHIMCMKNQKEVIFNDLSTMRWSSYQDDVVNEYSQIKLLDLHSGQMSTLMELRQLESFDKVSSMDCTDDFLVCGTFNGYCHLQNLKNSEHHSKIITSSENGLINCTKAYQTNAMMATNDGLLIVTDLNTLQTTKKLHLNWPVNSIACNPQSPWISVLAGDNLNSFVMDQRQGEIPVAVLKGHKDYCFTCDWSPDGMTIATGSQDSTVRTYDLRNATNSNHSVMGSSRNNSISCVKFNNNSKILAFAEDIDYINLVNLEDNTGGRNQSSYHSCQTISIFGQPIGLQFSQVGDGNGELLTLGINDDSVGGVLSYELESDMKALDYDFL